MNCERSALHTLRERRGLRHPGIKWRPTANGNVEVLNDTRYLYSYFDATKQVEFLYKCIAETIEVELPKEIEYLKNYDEYKSFVESYIEMPEKYVTLLIKFLYQNNGIFSKRALSKEFAKLTSTEIRNLEKKFKEVFNL